MGTRKMGTGFGTLTGLCASVFLQIKPRWGTDHPRVVVVLYAITLVTAVLYVLQFVLIRDVVFGKPSPPISEAPGNSGNQVGGNNSGRMIQAGAIGTYNEAQAISVSTIPEPPSPFIRITNDTVMNLIQNRGRWIRQHDGSPMVVASAINRNETETNKAFPAEAIVVSLQFSDYQGSVRYISRAFWVEHTENIVDIKIGTFKHFLLGAAVDSHWVTFENERDKPLEEEAETIPFSQRFTHAIFARRIPITNGLCVTATVFSEKTGQNFDKRTFYL
jgi:hypothetical protein